MRTVLVSFGGASALAWLMLCALIGAEADRQYRIEHQEEIAQAAYAERVAAEGW